MQPWLDIRRKRTCKAIRWETVENVDGGLKIDPPEWCKQKIWTIPFYIADTEVQPSLARLFSRFNRPSVHAGEQVSMAQLALKRNA